MKDLILEAVKAIRTRRPGAALTGAGISAESGISTYRDPGGLWDQYEEGSGGGMLAVLAAHPEKAPEILGGFFGRLEKAVPNPGHLALVDLERMGLLRSVITQNVDGLHRQAGSSTVRELHGSLYRLRCTACQERRPLDRSSLFDLAGAMLKKISESSLAEMAASMPRCSCGEPMRFDFVGFGEAVQDLDLANRDAAACGWMLIVGTSGVVHPAASLPGLARSQGAFLIEVNPKKSDLTSSCDVFLEGAAGMVLPRLVTELKETGPGP